MLSRPRPALHFAKLGHKWLSLGAFVFWILQAFTGVLLSFHFELEDALISTEHVPTNFAKINTTLNNLDATGGKAQVYWIWTSAGLQDRYVVNLIDQDGTGRRIRINGVGQILKDRKVSDHTVLSFMRAVHINLLSGKTGSLVLAATGVLLLTNAALGLIAAWPKRGTWKRTLLPSLREPRALSAKLYAWHRAIGLWGAIPALLIIGTGVLLTVEHEIGDALGAEDASLPPIAPSREAIGLAQAVEAAVNAIPGSRFVGTTLPSSKDASYYTWVRAPGELYRGGYGASLVIVDANTGFIRGAYPITSAPPALAFVKSLYPIHTGEAAGLFGRIAAMLTGIWLLATIGFGMTLWFKRKQGVREKARAVQSHEGLTHFRD